MGIKIKVQGVPYYVCSPATADGSRISVPVLPEKYTDWNDTLSKYLLKDQYEGAEGNVRWESPACVAYGYAVDNGCGHVKSDNDAWSPFYTQNLRIENHPILGTKIEALPMSFPYSINDYVFYSDYLKTTIDITASSTTVFHFYYDRGATAKGYHFICGKGKHTITTKVFPSHLSISNKGTCIIGYEQRNLGYSGSYQGTLGITGIPSPQYYLSIFDVLDNYSVAKFTAWDDSTFANWKDYHWRAETSILSYANSASQPQTNNYWGSFFVVPGLLVGRHTKNGKFYNDDPLKVSAPTDSSYVTNILLNNQLITTSKSWKTAYVNVAAKSSIPVISADDFLGTKNCVGGTTALYNTMLTASSTTQVPYSSLPVRKAPNEFFTAPISATVFLKFTDNELRGYHFSSLIVNPCSFDTYGYQIKCTNLFYSKPSYEIFTRNICEDWSDTAALTIDATSDYVNLTSLYKSINVNSLAEIAVKAKCGPYYSASCTLPWYTLKPSNKSAELIKSRGSSITLSNPDITVFYKWNKLAATVLVNSNSKFCTKVSLNGETNSILAGGGNEFDLSWERPSWQVVSSYDTSSINMSLSSKKEAVNSISNIKSMYTNNKVQVYWCKIPNSAGTTFDHPEFRHFSIANNFQNDIKININGTWRTLATHKEYVTDVTSAPKIMVQNTADNIDYYWEIEPTQSPSASFTNASSSFPYRFAKLGKKRTIIELAQPTLISSELCVVVFTQGDDWGGADWTIDGKAMDGQIWWSDDSDSLNPSAPSPYTSYYYCYFQGDFVSSRSSFVRKTTGYPCALRIVDMSTLQSTGDWESSSRSELYVLER